MWRIHTWAVLLMWCIEATSGFMYTTTKTMTIIHHLDCKLNIKSHEIWCLLFLSVASKSGFYIISCCDKMSIKKHQGNKHEITGIWSSQSTNISYDSNFMKYSLCLLNSPESANSIFTPTICLFYKKVRRWSNRTGIIWYHFWSVCEIEFIGEEDILIAAQLNCVLALSK